jgi:phosphoribosylaminoimidazolecarboxamide formyltransferase/IMP cyclohydrolase
LGKRGKYGKIGFFFSGKSIYHLRGRFFLNNFAGIVQSVLNKPLTIKSALISVYHKTGLDHIIAHLQKSGVTIYTTGGTYSFLAEKGINAEKIEDLTGYPSILGGRVKTLHPKVFGAILGRRELDTDVAEMENYEIPAFDLVVVDLYPFEDTLKSGASAEDIIEKIDIGGISLIRAAAKNFEHVLVIPSQAQYPVLEKVLAEQNGSSSLEQRKAMAAASFGISSSYDGLIGSYLSANADHKNITPLRYGENPHQKAEFQGDLNAVFDQLNGKELSFNNLVDVDAALELVSEFEGNAFCIIKHTNPCGTAVADTSLEAWNKALAADPVSAFGGIIATNREIDLTVAQEMVKIFFEVCAAPSYTQEALALLSKKKNRIILKVKDTTRPARVEKTILNGKLVQDRDSYREQESDLKTVTNIAPSKEQIADLLFANRLVKHAKSNTIILAKNKQLIGIGVGQTSRVDALKQAIEKAEAFGFSTEGAVMASDAFFPFPDCVEIAKKAGIAAVIQPGGSIRDQDSIDFCNSNALPMVTTGYRHFKH